ncbi:hypothetical protein EDB89DRAFT_1166852 [Lactarius sanguifluus]|nr:hypothetical protein EDB89DRAFT_1166852 [Lactarius sanguifluus]
MPCGGKSSCWRRCPVSGTTWKYVSEKQIRSLGLMALGYPEPSGLLVRPEYDVTLAMLNEDHETAKKRKSGGVVVTGQPGTGKTCFFYYLLLHKLSEMIPVAIELPNFFILFRDDGVHRHPLNASPHNLPEHTWALSDSNGPTNQPCLAFLGASKQKFAWIVQTTSPAEARWRQWRKYCTADMFVMNHTSIEDIMALSKLLNLDVGNIQRLYTKWGPSVHTCTKLLHDGESDHEDEVKDAAGVFVKDPLTIPKFNKSKVSHLLFSIRPESQNRKGRRRQIPEMATDHIKMIILYAAAEAKAQDRIYFYQTISTQPEFSAPANKMFKAFVLCWLYARPNVEPLRCFATDQPDLEIPACGEKQTTFFDSKNGLRTVNRNKLPLCLLPISAHFTTADAIVITGESIITIQVTLSDQHSAEGSGVDEINKLVPGRLKRDKLRHVFVTNDDNMAASLRNQTFTKTPENILVYSGVFDIGRSGVTREHMEVFNEKKNSKWALAARDWCLL